MRPFLIIVALAAYVTGFLAAQRIASDIQLILVAVLWVGGTIMLGLVSVIDLLVKLAAVQEPDDQLQTVAKKR